MSINLTFLEAMSWLQQRTGDEVSVDTDMEGPGPDVAVVGVLSSETDDESAMRSFGVDGSWFLDFEEHTFLRAREVGEVLWITTEAETVLVAPATRFGYVLAKRRMLVQDVVHSTVKGAIAARMELLERGSIRADDVDEYSVVAIDIPSRYS